MLRRKEVGNPIDYFNKSFAEYKAGFESRGKFTFWRNIILSLISYILSSNSKTVGDIKQIGGRKFYDSSSPQASCGSALKSFTNSPRRGTTAFVSPLRTSTGSLMWRSLTSLRLSQ